MKKKNIKKDNFIRPACQFDFSQRPIPFDIRCTQCGGKCQSFTVDCSAYTDALYKYLQNRKNSHEKEK